MAKCAICGNSGMMIGESKTPCTSCGRMGCKKCDPSWLMLTSPNAPGYVSRFCSESCFNGYSDPSMLSNYPKILSSETGKLPNSDELVKAFEARQAKAIENQAMKWQHSLGLRPVDKVMRIRVPPVEVCIYTWILVTKENWETGPTGIGELVLHGDHRKDVVCQVEYVQPALDALSQARWMGGHENLRAFSHSYSQAEQYVIILDNEHSVIWLCLSKDLLHVLKAYQDTAGLADRFNPDAKGWNDLQEDRQRHLRLLEDQSQIQFGLKRDYLYSFRIEIITKEQVANDVRLQETLGKMFAQSEKGLMSFPVKVAICGKCKMPMTYSTKENAMYCPQCASFIRRRRPRTWYCGIDNGSVEQVEYMSGGPHTGVKCTQCWLIKESAVRDGNTYASMGNLVNANGDVVDVEIVCGKCWKPVAIEDKVCPECKTVFIPVGVDRAFYETAMRKCPVCSMQMEFYTDHKKWYCHSCKEFEDVLSKRPKGQPAAQTQPSPPASQPAVTTIGQPASQYPCRTCGQPLQFAPQYQKWYCPTCKTYL